MICSSTGNFEKAAWLYLRAAEVSPTDYQPLVYLCQAYSDMGRKVDENKARHRAIGLIERALEVNPDDARARYMGVANFATMGEKAKAIEWANLALRSSEDEPMVFYNAACTFAVLGEQERAIDLLKRAVDLGWGDRAWMEHGLGGLTARNARPETQRRGRSGGRGRRSSAHPDGRRSWCGSLARCTAPPVVTGNLRRA